MNEKQLKSLFCNALTSGHISNNDILPTPCNAHIKIVEEANFRSFDLVIAAIEHEPIAENDYAYYNSLLVRMRLFEQFARSEKCRINCIRFYPVEIKSDDDTIDERLPIQIINAILTFGLSVLVLDKNHAKKVRTSALKFLPATVICFTGVKDHFEVLSSFDRVISDGIFNFNRLTIAKVLTQNHMSGRVYSRLTAIQQILQKLAFNQIFFEDLGLTEEELKFMRQVVELEKPSNGRKRLSALIKETTNTKMTEFM
jgi:hypothetical protein